MTVVENKGRKNSGKKSGIGLEQFLEKREVKC